MPFRTPGGVSIGLRILLKPCNASRQQVPKRSWEGGAKGFVAMGYTRMLAEKGIEASISGQGEGNTPRSGEMVSHKDTILNIYNLHKSSFRTTFLSPRMLPGQRLRPLSPLAV